MDTIITPYSQHPTNTLNLLAFVVWIPITAHGATKSREADAAWICYLSAEK